MVISMMRIKTFATQNKTIPTEYYTNKIEFSTTQDNTIIFWDIELEYWITLDVREIIYIID